MIGHLLAGHLWRQIEDPRARAAREQDGAPRARAARGPRWHTPGMATDAPELLIADQSAWRAWLRRHNQQAGGVWLVLAKKGFDDPTSLSYDQALEEALCQGWIDGQVRRRDERTYRQRFTPRRPRSRWSRRNVEIVQRLDRAGRMRAAGLAAVQQAKDDGRWETAYAGQSTIEVSADLASALALEPRALAMFEILTNQNRYAVLHRIGAAKRSDTRARRIAQFVAMLGRGETVYRQRRTL